MDIGDVLAIEHDFAAADGFETANGTKERTLSASRGSDKDDEFLFFNLKIDVLKSVKSFVKFLDLSQFQISHRMKLLKVRFFWGANNAGWVTAARKRSDISHIPRAEARFFYSFCTQIQKGHNSSQTEDGAGRDALRDALLRDPALHFSKLRLPVLPYALARLPK